MPRNTRKQCYNVLADRSDFKTVLKKCSMFPDWHHAVPESAYFKVPEMLKTFRMCPTSRFVYVLHWLATRLLQRMVVHCGCCRQRLLVCRGRVNTDSGSGGEDWISASFVILRLNDLVITFSSMASLSEVGHLCLGNCHVVFQGRPVASNV